MKQLKKTILTLVALLAVTTGAWADETPLTTITPTGTGTYSETTTGVVTVTHDNSGFVGAYGWLWNKEGAITVEAKDGYTITRCVFRQAEKNPVTVSTAPFKVKFVEVHPYGDEYVKYLCDGTDLNGMDGVTSIEVYGYETPAPSGPEVAWNKTEKSGTFTMPGGNVTLEPEYYPQAELTAAPTAIDNVPATTDGAIVEAGTVANIGETTNAQGTVMYYVSQTALDDAALLALAADQWTADVPTAADLAQGQAHVYYYVRGNDGETDDEIFSDGDIVKAANALTVTIAAAPTYAVTFADGVNPEPPAQPEWTASPATDVKKGQTVTVTYSGTKKVIGVKAEKKGGGEPVTLGTPLTIEAITDGTIKVNMNGALTTGMKYSVNGGTPTLITTTTNIEGLKAGDKVQFYGNGTQTQAYGNYPEVIIQGSGDGFQTKAYGNIMSLLDEEGFATKTDLPNTSYVFYGLFKGNTTLVDASELLLPATTLANSCYQIMFQDCTSLTTAPKLPATTLTTACYYSMFSGCTSLTNAYVKAAFKGEDNASSSMFVDCSATGAVLHTTPDNKASWEAKMGTGKTWPNWTVADDWEE